MRVLLLCMAMMFGVVSCLMPEDPSNTKYGEEYDADEESFIDKWCKVKSPFHTYERDGVIDGRHGSIDPKEIHISNHTSDNLTENDVKELVKGETITKNGVRLIKVSGRVHTWRGWVNTHSSELKMDDLAIKWFKNNNRKGYLFCNGFKNGFPLLDRRGRIEYKIKELMEDENKRDHIWQFIGHPDGRLTMVTMGSSRKGCNNTQYDSWQCAGGELLTLDKDGNPIRNFINQDNGLPKLISIRVRIHSPMIPHSSN